MGLADSPLSSGFCALGNGFHITSIQPCSLHSVACSVLLCFSGLACFQSWSVGLTCANQAWVKIRAGFGCGVAFKFAPAVWFRLVSIYFAQIRMCQRVLFALPSMPCPPCRHRLSPSSHQKTLGTPGELGVSVALVKDD